MAVFNISLANDASFPGSPTNGQVLQFSSSEGNKWTPVTLSGGGGLTTTARTTSYTAVAYDHVLANATSGVLTVTLPSASTAGNGAVVRVTKTDASTNAVTVRPATGNLNGLSGGSLTDTTVRTANYTAVNLDNVLCNASGGLFTVTLPAPTAGRLVRVTKVDTSVNAVLVAPPSGAIDGSPTASVNVSGSGRNFFADGSAWRSYPNTHAITTKQLDSQDFVSDGTTWWSV
ncbi:MAG: hypothetical protein WBP26_04260 [Candidatus Saccharimonadales bacterium]